MSTEPIPIGTGIVAVHSLFDPLPDFIKGADLVFTDPPWNLSLLNNFGHRAGLPRADSFTPFFKRLFSAIAEIAPQEAFVEIGKQHLCDFIAEMKRIYPHVTFYNNTYYHKAANFAYIVHGQNKTQKYPLDNMDEEDAVAWICQYVKFDCVADLCMGKGATGFYANKHKRRFAGIELNPERLAVLTTRIQNGKM